METEGKLSLRERAAQAWKRERPLRETARVQKLVKQIEAAEAKLARMFGSECEIKMGLSPAGTVRAEVEDLRFLADYYEDDFFCSLSIILMERCAFCGRELMLGGVDNLEDVGKNIEEFEQEHIHRYLTARVDRRCLVTGRAGQSSTGCERVGWKTLAFLP